MSNKNTDIQNIISETVNQTVLKLKSMQLMKENQTDILKKTEWALKNYPLLMRAYSENGTAEKLSKVIENALKEIEDDEYYSIIPLTYITCEKREKIAAFFDTTETTISRNKRRLLQKLATLIFADEVIKDLFL